MRLGIIGGAGLLGATTAFYTAASNLVDEIVLYDVKDNHAMSHAMDIDQAVSEFSSTKVSVGAFNDLADCEVILQTAGIPEKSASSRTEYLDGNIEIIKEIAKKMKAWKTSPIVISASNPVDVLNYKMCEFTEFSSEKVIGFSRNDTLRLKWATAKEIGIPASQIDGLVIGEHGENQVPLFSSLKMRSSNDQIALSEKQQRNILKCVKTWFMDYQALNSGRSSGWTSGIGLFNVIRHVIDDNEEIIPCSVIPSGEYGLSGLSIGLPVKLGKTGVRKIIEIDLTEMEKKELTDAADKIIHSIMSVSKEGATHG